MLFFNKRKKEKEKNEKKKNKAGRIPLQYKQFLTFTR